jgi:DNA-binding Xre family transcriptional regulator
MRLHTYIYGRNIQLQMTKHNLSTSEVAAQLCITPVTFNRIRTGRMRQIDPDLLYQLKTIFNCTANDLLEAHPDIDYSTIKAPSSR